MWCSGSSHPGLGLPLDPSLGSALFCAALIITTKGFLSQCNAVHLRASVTFWIRWPRLAMAAHLASAHLPCVIWSILICPFKCSWSISEAISDPSMQNELLCHYTKYIFHYELFTYPSLSLVQVFFKDKDCALCTSYFIFRDLCWALHIVNNS